MKRRSDPIHTTTSAHNLVSDIITNDDILSFRKLVEKKSLKSVLNNLQIQYPLHFAASHGSVKILEYLMNKLPDKIFDNNTEGWTLIHSAASAGQHQSLSSIFKFYPNIYKENTTTTGETALSLAVGNNHLNAAQVLINSGALIKTHNNKQKGLTPLCIAAKAGNLDMLQLLLNNGASIEEHDFNQLTPLCYAAAAGMEEAAQLLLSKRDSAIRDGISIRKALPLAAEKGHTNLVNLFYNSSPDIKLHVTPSLYSAIKNGHIDVVNILLNSAPSKEYPILLYIAVENRHEKIVDLLLQYEFDVNIDYNKGETALHIAVRNGDFGIAKKLIEYGAQPNIYDFKLVTPLHTAVKMGDLNLTELLLQHNADTKISLKDKTTPLHTAVQQGLPNMVALLLKYNANCYATTSNESDTPNASPLDLAVKLGQHHIANILQDALKPLQLANTTFLQQEPLEENTFDISTVVEGEEGWNLDILGQHPL